MNLYSWRVMRANLKTVLLLAVALRAFTGSAPAQSELGVGIKPGYPGATASVPVNLREPAGGIVAAQFDVTFNAGKAAAGNALATARLPNHTVKSRDVAPGVRRTLIYSAANLAIQGTNGPIVTLPFTLSPFEIVGSGPLTPGGAILARADGTSLVPERLTAGAIFVRVVNLLPNGHVQFYLESTPGERYAIQAATNLVDWVNISTNTAVGGFMDLVDINAANHPYRFYRWQRLSP